MLSEFKSFRAFWTNISNNYDKYFQFCVFQTNIKLIHTRPASDRYHALILSSTTTSLFFNRSLRNQLKSKYCPTGDHFRIKETCKLKWEESPSDKVRNVRLTNSFFRSTRFFHTARHKWSWCVVAWDVQVQTCKILISVMISNSQQRDQLNSLKHAGILRLPSNSKGAFCGKSLSHLCGVALFQAIGI